jgi:hypothetical protein
MNMELGQSKRSNRGPEEDIGEAGSINYFFGYA